ncbi:MULTISPECIES: hypothetical protein [unclassified Mesorhizobium]|uniref:hypothetical protein n=1 Tax=unclassified Mesorhizobium TaxID=325217 RepID=UPI0003CE26B4|nr:hypothetical protein [Mesorhizobium sp. LNJC391B00]ESY29454.1 hypothetical protein X749_16060 [Mesorhizobium sp. LNJC391B00]
MNADAAAFIIQQRQIDPAAYVRKVIPAVDTAFKNLSTPEDLQAAVALSFAAQRQLGIAKPQPLPLSDAEGLIKARNDTPDPDEAERKALEAIIDQKSRKALATQLDNIKAAQSDALAASDGDPDADGFDDAGSECPSNEKFAKSIDLSPADILRLKKNSCDGILS